MRYPTREEALAHGGCGAVHPIRDVWRCDTHRGDGLHRMRDGYGGYFFWLAADDPAPATKSTGIVPTRTGWTAGQLAGVIGGGTLFAVGVAAIAFRMVSTGLGL